MHQNQAKLTHENNAKSYQTYVIITYFDAPECRMFHPLDPTGALTWTPPGGLKRHLGHPADLAKIVPKISTPRVLDPGYAHEISL